MDSETLTTPNQPLNGKEEIDRLSLLLTKKELELSALLEITKSINSNLPESSLYKIFHFTLLGNLHIPKLALFVCDDTHWVCKVAYGTATNAKNLQPAPFMGSMVDISLLEEHSVAGYEDFDIAVPIAHKNQVLAYVFIGGVSLPEGYKQSTLLSFVKTFTSIIIVAIENKKMARKQLHQEALRKEMEIAKDVQSMLFPKQLPNNNMVHIHATYLPNFSIGGDYYDYIAIDTDNFMVCIADVSGKGISAALLMSNFQASLRTLVRQTTALEQIVQELNHSIISNAKGERFVTFFIALINTKMQTITYINAGHNPSFLVNNNNQVQMLEKGCTVLGAFVKIPFIEQEQICYTPGSLLFCYTDGLTETNNDALEEFGMKNIEDFLQQFPHENLVQNHEILSQMLNEYKGEQSFPDDITYLSCLLK